MFLIAQDTAAWFADPEKATVVGLLVALVTALMSGLLVPRWVHAKAEERCKKWEELILQERSLTRQAVTITETLVRQKEQG